MKVVVLYGSNRSGRQGIRAAKFIVKQLESRNHTVTLLDSKEENLPFLDKMYKEYPEGEAPENLQRISKTLSDADGFILVSGEWNHSIPPPLKNMLDYFSVEYHYKPSAIASYSAGPFGGVRSAVHVRAITGELGMPSIPTMFPISGVGKSFTEDGEDIEGTYTRRIQRFIDEFEWYMEALKTKRDSD